MASGPLVTAHLLRSKLAMWLLPERAAQMTPLRSTSMPRGANPVSIGSRAEFSIDGGWYISAMHVSGGLSPRSRRTIEPGNGPVRVIQTAWSIGLAMMP